VRTVFVVDNEEDSIQAKSDLIVSFSDASVELSQVGGKGASLARLAVAGLPVPPSFHITTAAYRQFVAEHGILEQILATVSAANHGQPLSGALAVRKPVW